jgi:CBS domain-containing protein
MLVKIKDVMVKNVITITKEKTAYDAAAIMKDNGIGSLVVVEKDYPVGIVTERDLCIKVIAKKLNPENVLVKGIMTKTIITAFEDDDFDEVNKRMLNNKIKKIPVLRDDKLVGIFTDTDLRKYIYQLENKMIIE